MKRLVCLILVLVSVAAVAGSDDYDKAAKWIQSKFTRQQVAAGLVGADFLGLTPDGRPCGLYLTNFSDNSYYVVVGYQNAKDPNDYIGIGMEPGSAEIKVNDTQMFFHINQPWGNDSKVNTVTIELDGDGSPLSATGVSDLKEISCRHLSNEIVKSLSQ